MSPSTPTRQPRSGARRGRRECLEHGHLIDEATAKLMADKDVWLSTQPFLDEGTPAG